MKFATANLKSIPTMNVGVREMMNAGASRGLQLRSLPSRCVMLLLLLLPGSVSLAQNTPDVFSPDRQLETEARAILKRLPASQDPLEDAAIPTAGAMETDPLGANSAERFDANAFIADPDYTDLPYDADLETNIYTGKYPNRTQRPWIELGRGLYQPGEIPPSETWLGETNLVAQHFLVYGDFRTATAYNRAAARDKVVSGNRLNLDLDWKLTATERIHAFIGPIDRVAQTTRAEFNRGDLRFFDEFDHNFDTVYFEGDFGALYGGWAGIDTPFDLPFAVGLIPVFYQNGVWIEDALVGAIVTIPARNSPALDWSNFDVSFFAGIDELNSPAFGTDDSAASVYGTHWAIDLLDGYLELGYAFLDDSTFNRRSYHNVGASFTRRYWQRISNSIRFISNSSQDPIAAEPTADGQVFILENAWISSQPNNVVPYLNLFVGLGSPQSVARAGVAGGLLRNVGINFETDLVTGYPLLDDTANNTYGGAAGINLLGPSFSYQIIAEFAWLHTFDESVTRRANGDQYAAGVRYQLPLNHAWILRMDAMHGFLENEADLTGTRIELRYKF